MVSLKGARVNDNHWLLISSSLPSHWTPLPKIALQEHLRKYLSQHRSRLWTKKISEIRGKYPIALSDFSADQSRINLKSKLISILYSRLITYQSSFSGLQGMSKKVFVFFSEYLYFSFFLDISTVTVAAVLVAAFLVWVSSSSIRRNAKDSHRLKETLFFI